MMRKALDVCEGACEDVCAETTNLRILESKEKTRGGLITEDYLTVRPLDVSFAGGNLKHETDERSKSRGQTRLDYALQGGGNDAKRHNLELSLTADGADLRE